MNDHKFNTVKIEGLKNAFTDSDFKISEHAQMRMYARRFSQESVCKVLDYGRVFYARGAKIHVIGKREVEKYKNCGIDLRSCEGVHVICSNDGYILTLYKNHDLRDLRYKSRYWRVSSHINGHWDKSIA